MGAVQNAICDGTSCYYEASCDKHLNISMRVTIPKANGGFKEFVIDEYYLKVPGNVLDPIKGRNDRCYLGIFPNNASLDLSY